jgi:hypothetical protein
MILNKDFREFIELLNSNNVRYLIVGGYALALHGHPRYTKDIDVWVWISEQNARNIVKSLQQFGFSNPNLTEQDFLTPGIIVQLGYPPHRIDILTQATGVDFEECYSSRIELEIDGLIICFIDIENLRKNKKALGRLQDLADLENLK